MTEEKSDTMMQIIKTKVSFVKAFLPFISFLASFLILYSIYPASLEPTWTGTWKNRMGYLFFLWLFLLETILSWEALRAEKFRLKSVRTMVFIIALFLPTAYVIVSNYFGLNTFIVNLSMQYNVRPDWAALMPLSTEYLVFAVLLVLIVFLRNGVVGIKTYSVSMLLLVTIGSIYTIDNLYPFGEFTPFQIMVPSTAMFAANVLNLMGYETVLSARTQMPYLFVAHQKDSFGALIAWPCSGVESLLIYSVTILLFLKKSAMQLKYKIAYFAVGAVITYLINIFRIVTIFVIGVNNGDWGLFHDYYGPLYSLAWIITYPLIVLGSQALISEIKDRKIKQENTPTDYV